jgi:hypothetical protein
MLTLPLIQSGSFSTLTPFDQSIWHTEQIITALMMEATLREDLSDVERDTYTILSVAMLKPAES